jgi:RNA polymerase sigma factor (sigma-70 family)
MGGNDYQNGDCFHMSTGTDHDTSAGGHPQWFVTTHWTVVLTAGRNDPRAAQAALEQLCRAYWQPLYAYVRRRGHNFHDAQDLTQEFFARLLQAKSLGAVDRGRGRFRSFMLGAFNHFLANEYDRANAAKRGGGRVALAWDDQAAEAGLSPETDAHLSPERAYDKRWAITVLEQAFARLRDEFVATGRSPLFDELKAFLADGTDSGDYSAVGAKLGMTANAVAVAVHRLRHRYREIVRAEVAHTVGSPGEIEEEIRHLFRRPR